MAAKVRIISVPTGEAPLWVREKWVGLELPLDQQHTRPIRVRTAGVMSGPKSVLAALIHFILGRHQFRSGYAISAVEAIEILGKSSPDAAAWWRENAKHMLVAKCRMIFLADECEIV